MFDFRLHTFLTLCKTRNYTKTAQVLHITQPAVTGHIKYLEEHYQMKLFSYTGKTLTLTPQGEHFQKLVATMQADLEKALSQIRHLESNKIKLNFGATLTIGEYTMPDLLKAYMQAYPHHEITMIMDNTQNLLTQLNEGKLDFALIEGYFNKSDYTYRLLSEERFIPVCSAMHPLATQSVTLQQLFKERLIIRESGSGSRDIFERALQEYNHTITAFNGLVEIGNLNVIKELVASQLGITFIYETAVKEELSKGHLAPIDVKDFNLLRAFYFTCPKNSLFQENYLKCFTFFKEVLQSTH